ncbi:hypothetical protein [Lentzea nigeriaca]|uniref:hypothetical protein n=1 Tax=Lentzea nigeriaca TaxID=1128665 RepID=UPI00195D2057|nr:hypothetical protein [Lentzea nigeriaca]MBM7865098.1 hypothetical protein [Lentzea nigeriaca]
MSFSLGDRITSVAQAIPIRHTPFHRDAGNRIVQVLRARFIHWRDKYGLAARVNGRIIANFGDTQRGIEICTRFAPDLQLAGAFE